jgi:hypothetical protein
MQKQYAKLKDIPEGIREKRPLSSFNLNDPEQVKAAFSPSNLMWLPAWSNLKKNDKKEWVLG